MLQRVRIAPSLLLAGFLGLTYAVPAQVAGPVLVGMNEYAFQYTPSPGIGMFFNSTNQQYELRDAAATPAFWLRPQSDQAMFRGRVSIGTNAAPAVELDVNGTAQVGDGVNYARIDDDGDLSFAGTGDYLVGNNRYAFRSASNQNYGLFFNAASLRYEFRDGTANPDFYIEASTGGAVSASFIRPGGTGNTTPGNIRFNGSDLQGYVGGSWVSLTAAGGGGSDDQNLSLAGTTLSIEDGNSVNLSGFLDNTDNQTLSLVGTTVSISGGNSVNLAGIAGDSDWTVAGSNVYNSTAYVGVGVSDPDANRIYAERASPDKAAVVGSEASGAFTYSEGRLGYWNGTNPLGLPLSTVNIGVLGTKGPDGSSGIAVYGYNSDDAPTNHAGVFISDGAGTINYGVYGDASNGITNWAGYFDGQVYAGENNGTTTDAVVNIETNAASSSEKGIHAVVNYNGTSDIFAVHGESVTNPGWGYGGYFLGGYRGVHGWANATTYAGTAYGVYGYATGSSAGTRVGVYGYASGGSTGNNWAGYFSSGDVYVANNMAIGTTIRATGYDLSVNGGIICEELLIQDNGSWPDYVFGDGYELMPLDELRAAIERDGHLPNVPGACTVEEEGIAVGDMQKTMMEKIEELTLYVLELHDEIEVLKAGNETLKSSR